jgi:hypothetical protein
VSGPSGTAWAKTASNRASWAGDDWTLRINFHDSQNCGGSNPSTQSGTATRQVSLAVPRTLSISMSGVVETQNGGYEQAEARVDGSLVASGGSFEEGGGCTMKAASAGGSILLQPGDHVIELSASTVDGLYHVGAYWEFTLIWS